MEITYNTLNSPTNLITYTGIPNILTVTQDVTGTNATYTILVNSHIADYASMDDRWITLTLNDIDYSIQSTDTYDYNNNNFFISTNQARTAYSICRALKNIAVLATNYDIYMPEPSYYQIVIKAKDIGTKFNLTITSNISDALTINSTDGSSSSYYSRIGIDLYTDKYITSLIKNTYHTTTRFDLSGLLSTVTDYGSLTPYTLKVYGIYENGTVYSLTQSITGYSCMGYQVNQGNNYTELTEATIAQNVTRGSVRPNIANNTVLYIYGGNDIELSYYSPTQQTLTANVTYLTSALETVATDQYEYTVDVMSLTDMVIPTSHLWASDIYYIDVTINNATYRYNCINPVTATSFCQRVWFRNSYGGISFFDFTGNREEERSTEITTYQRSHYDYYDGKNEFNKIYDVDNTIQVKLTSHLITEDGKWLFNDLINSKDIWTEVNGQLYSIIPKSIAINDTDVPNLYTATLTYNYSSVENLL